MLLLVGSGNKKRHSLTWQIVTPHFISITFIWLRYVFSILILGLWSGFLFTDKLNNKDVVRCTADGNQSETVDGTNVCLWEWTFNNFLGKKIVILEKRKKRTLNLRNKKNITVMENNIFKSPLKVWPNFKY